MHVWLKAHKDQEIWEGTTLQTVARAVSGVARYSDWLSQMSTTGHWLDTAAMLGLAAAFGVDVAIFLDGQSSPCIVGASLVNLGSDLMIPIALANDRHFWAMRPLAGDDDVVQFVDKGGLVSCSSSELPRKLPGDHQGKSKDGDEPEPEFDLRLGASVQDFTHRITVEMSLCEALVAWDPFQVPSPALLQSLQHLADARCHAAVQAPRDSDVIFGRQMALVQMQEEREGAEVLRAKCLYAPKLLEQQVDEAFC